MKTRVFLLAHGVRGCSSVTRGASTRMRSLSSSSNVAASSAPLFAGQQQRPRLLDWRERLGVDVEGDEVERGLGLLGLLLEDRRDQRGIGAVGVLAVGDDEQVAALEAAAIQGEAGDGHGLTNRRAPAGLHRPDGVAGRERIRRAEGDDLPGGRRAGAGAELVHADQHRRVGVRSGVAGERADEVDGRGLRRLDLAPPLAPDAVVHAAGHVDQHDGGEPVLPDRAGRRRQPRPQRRGELARLAVGAPIPRAPASGSTSRRRSSGRRIASETMLPMMSRMAPTIASSTTVGDLRAIGVPYRGLDTYLATPSRWASRFASDAPELRAPSM